MADISDVSNAVVQLISSTLYPNGTDSPSAIGLDAKVYAGWPIPRVLDEDLQLKPDRPTISHISVYPRPEERNTTRYQQHWHELSRQVPTLALTITAGSVPLTADSTQLTADSTKPVDFAIENAEVTLSGTPPPAGNPHNVMVMVNGLPFVYSVLPEQSLPDIMTALGALVSAQVPGVSVDGAVMTLPGSARLTAARVGITGTIRQEVARTEKVFQIVIWAPSPYVRYKLASFLDPVLKVGGEAGRVGWIDLADRSSARWIYRNSIENDRLQLERAYRRDYFYLAEWATFQTQIVPEIIVAQVNLYAGMQGAPAQFIDTTYS